jgi:hypothetical protein
MPSHIRLDVVVPLLKEIGLNVVDREGADHIHIYQGSNGCSVGFRLPRKHPTTLTGDLLAKLGKISQEAKLTFLHQYWKTQ